MAERQLGVRRGVADVDREVAGYVVTNFDALRAGLDDQARAAAQAVDDAAGALLSAYERREDVARRMSALASAIHPVSPGDVAFSRAEAAARAADALLTSGGEAAPALRHDPRQPVGGMLAEADA